MITSENYPHFFLAVPCNFLLCRSPGGFFSPSFFFFVYNHFSIFFSISFIIINIVVTIITILLLLLLIIIIIIIAVVNIIVVVVIIIIIISPFPLQLFHPLCSFVSGKRLRAASYWSLHLSTGTCPVVPLRLLPPFPSSGWKTIEGGEIFDFPT